MCSGVCVCARVPGGKDLWALLSDYALCPSPAPSVAEGAAHGK